jgi:hypothetical protein
MKKMYIPPATIAKMNALRISEETIHDVFNNGVFGKFGDGTPLMVKKFHYYEIGLAYKIHATNGDYVITSVWKRPRAK